MKFVSNTRFFFSVKQPSARFPRAGAAAAAAATESTPAPPGLRVALRLLAHTNSLSLSDRARRPAIPIDFKFDSTCNHLRRAPDIFSLSLSPRRFSRHSTLLLIRARYANLPQLRSSSQVPSSPTPRRYPGLFLFQNILFL